MIYNVPQNFWVHNHLIWVFCHKWQTLYGLIWEFSKFFKLIFYGFGEGGGCCLWRYWILLTWQIGGTGRVKFETAQLGCKLKQVRVEKKVILSGLRICLVKQVIGRVGLVWLVFFTWFFFNKKNVFVIWKGM